MLHARHQITINLSSFPDLQQINDHLRKAGATGLLILLYNQGSVQGAHLELSIKPEDLAKFEELEKKIQNCVLSPTGQLSRRQQRLLAYRESQEQFTSS